MKPPGRVEAEKPRSIQQKVGAAVRLSQEQPSDEDLYWQASETRRSRSIQPKTSTRRIYMHARLTTAQQCKRERGTTAWQSPEDKRQSSSRPFVVASKDFHEQRAEEVRVDAESARSTRNNFRRES